jgi:hypothetical protein
MPLTPRDVTATLQASENPIRRRVNEPSRA